MLEAHLATAGGQGDRVGGVEHDGLGGEHLVHPLRRRRGSLGLRDDHAEHPQRPDQQRDVDVERHQLTEAQLPVDDEVAAVGEHQHQADVGQQVEERDEAATDAGGEQRHVVEVAGRDAQLPGLHRLGAEALDDAHPRHGLLDDLGERRRLALHAHHGRVQPRGEALRQHVEQREAAHREDGQHHVDAEHDDGRGQHGDEVGHRERDHHHEVHDLLQVGVGPAHQLTGLRVVVVGEVQPLQVGEHAVPQGRLAPARLAERPVAAQAGEQRRDHADADDDQRPLGDLLLVARGDALIDRGLHQERDADLARRPRQAGDDADDQAAALGAHLRAQQRPPAPGRARGGWRARRLRTW